MPLRSLVAGLAALALAASGLGCDTRSKEVRLRIAAIRESVEAAPARLNSPFEDGMPPLHIALLNGYFDLADWLLARGADPSALDGAGNTAVHLALTLPAEDYRALRVLLDAGADVSALGANGETPLHHAAFLTRPVVLERLLAAHADANARSESGATPLHLAAAPQPSARDDEVARDVRALAAAGADVDARDAAQRTPLMLAALRGHAGAARALLRAGANVDARGPGGATALHVAAAMGSAPVVDALLDAQADPNGRDAEGFTPLAVARRRPAHRFAAEGGGPVDTNAVAHLLLQRGGVELPNAEDSTAPDRAPR